MSSIFSSFADHIEDQAEGNHDNHGNNHCGCSCNDDGQFTISRTDRYRDSGGIGGGDGGSGWGGGVPDFNVSDIFRSRLACCKGGHGCIIIASVYHC